MATFEKRGDHWRARIIRRPLGIDESFTAPTLAQCKAWATKREADILAGSRGLPTSHTLSEAIDEFIARVLPHRKGARWERLRLEKFRRDNPALCARPLHKLTQDDFSKWRDGRLTEVSPSSVGREMNLLGALFSVACSEWRWLQVSPMRAVKRPQEPPARRRGISAEEVAIIVSNLDNGAVNNQVKDAFLLALETGMRAGEILGLTWSHVDLQKRVVTLPKTKNGDSRQVPLSIAATAILQSLALISNGDGESANNKGLVFTITAASLDVLFRRARDSAVKDCPSVATVRFHDTRSEAITRLSRKLDVLELARVVGHRDLKSLLGYYAPTASDLAKKLD